MIVHIWYTLTPRSVGIQRNIHFIDGNMENISVSDAPRKRISGAPNFSSTTQSKTVKKWHWVTEVTANWYQIFQFLLSCHGCKKTLCLFPKCSVPLGCLPSSNRWSLTCSHRPCRCQQMPAGPGCPQTHRHLCQGTRGHASLWHTLFLFLSTLGKGTLTQQSGTVGDAYKKHRLYLTRVLRMKKKKSIVCTMLEQSLPPGKDTAFCQLWFPLLRVEY